MPTRQMSGLGRCERVMVYMRPSMAEVALVVVAARAAVLQRNAECLVR